MDYQKIKIWLEQKLKIVWEWINTNIVNWESVEQIFYIIFILGAAFVLSNKTASWTKNKFKDRRKSFIRTNASVREIYFLLYSTAFLWTATLFSEQIGTSFNVLRIAASLMTAWGIIRFTSSTIKSVFWSRVVAITLWGIAALNIIGALSPTIKLLDDASVNLGDVKFSLLMVIKILLAFSLLIWAVRFISNLLERSFRKSKILTPSQRVLFHKLTVISLYALAFFIGMNIVGLDLTVLTVFSGALGFGIGFGLQKVFSNLISGIILLLDKSVKPGDVIAIGDTYGWVNSLGARCISVITRDGKEHLIPNENLITQEVENWSYSDSRIRIHIPVGIAYDSDLPLAKKIMLEAVAKNPRVLADPEPRCLILGLGDSSIDHELRAWIDDPANGISNIKSDIYYNIIEGFRENNIEIPFPQRDVNMKPVSN